MTREVEKLGREMNTSSPDTQLTNHSSLFVQPPREDHYTTREWHDSMISLFYRRATSRTCQIAIPRIHTCGIASWHENISNSSNQFQIYTSKSNDPFINLSIEHHLFQTTPPGSKILFQYINRPCIVIGRNQNPWLEVNLALLNPANATSEDVKNGLDKIDLVRRRSGGGTVFHDAGNVNWSVICDFTDFTRDRHAEMVVRALRSLGVERARVNERHDIVLDQGELSQDPTLSEDTHSTPYTSPLRPLKVSGSAYKMARNRALHHGTALLSSENLGVIPRYLRSPARGHIEAKGVESVSSPVSNCWVKNGVFMDAVREHFIKQYRVPQNVQEVVVTDEALEIESVRKGHQEMKGEGWMWEQTPGFTFSSEPLEDGKVKIKNVRVLAYDCA